MPVAQQPHPPAPQQSSLEWFEEAVRSNVGATAIQNPQPEKLPDDERQTDDRRDHP